MRVLGIETTCDETAAAVVAAGYDGRGEILSNEVLSQIAEHCRLWRRRAGDRGTRACGGRRPARSRGRCARRTARSTTSTASRRPRVPASSAASSSGSPPRRHSRSCPASPFSPSTISKAHALTARLTDGIGFPYLLLLASGGHTQLVAVRGRRRLCPHRHDDRRCDRRGLRQGRRSFWASAIPAGRTSSARRAKGNPERFALPRPMLGRAGAELLAVRPQDRAAPRSREDRAAHERAMWPISAPAFRRRSSMSSSTAPASGCAPSATLPVIRPPSSSPAASRPTR